MLNNPTSRTDNLEPRNATSVVSAAAAICASTILLLCVQIVFTAGPGGAGFPLA